MGSGIEACLTREDQTVVNTRCDERVAQGQVNPYPVLEFLSLSDWI